MAKTTTAVASARLRRSFGGRSRRVSSSSPQPASRARQNRTKITIRPLWAVRKPGSVVTAEKNGSAPTTTSRQTAPNAATAMRVAVGRMISAIGASISVRPPAYQPRLLTIPASGVWVGRPQ